MNSSKFYNYSFTSDEKAMKDLIRETGESFAVSAISSAAFMLLHQIVVNGILAPKTTKIEIDGNVPAEIYAIKGKDGPKAVYISSKRSRVRLLPAIAIAAAGLFVHFAVNRKTDDKDEPINV